MVTIIPRAYFTQRESLIQSKFNHKIFVLANFSQLLPFCAIFHIDTIKSYLNSLLFLLYDMSEAGWGHFQNQPFGSYFLNPWTNWKNPCRGNIYFVPYINQHHKFFLYFSQISGKFFTMGQKWTFGQNPSLIFSFRHR